MKSPLYKKNFEEILQHLILIKKYNAVSSLINYVDDFNETINGNSGFNSQSIIQDIKSDFIGVYSRYEKMLRNKLYNKISELKKVENLEETFEKFIKKQKDLNFTFKIKNEDLTFYGSCERFNQFYEDLKKKYPFIIKPEEIFMDTYETQRTEIEIREKKKDSKKKKEN